MDWKALWMKFRGTFYFRIAYLLLIAAISALLLVGSVQSAAICLAVFVIPGLTLLIPHWFGERRMKHHALNALLVLAISTVLFAGIFAPILASQGEIVYERQGTRLSFSGGVVTPFRAVEGPRDFNFTVTMTSSDAQAGTFLVRVHVVSIIDSTQTLQTLTMTKSTGLNNPLSNGVYGDGEQFYAVVPLQPYPHYYTFDATNGTADGTLIDALLVPGPFHAPFRAYFVYSLIGGFFNMIFIVVGFFLLLMLYWWTRRAREIRGTQLDRGRKRDEGGGEFTCTNCGGDVSEADVKCPNCGAEFGPGPEAIDASVEAAKPKG